MQEIRAIDKLEGANLNGAKTVLAFEATQIAHGSEEAIRSYHAASSMFGSRIASREILPSSTIPRSDSDFGDISVPHSYIPIDQLKKGIPAFKLFHMVGLASSGGAARRLINQGGAYINGRRLEKIDCLITNNHLVNMEIILRSGKKRFYKIMVKK